MRGKAPETSNNDVISTLKKSLVPNSKWPDKDEFLDTVYWLRQIIGLLIGVLWGFLFMKGLIGLAGFLIVNCAFVYWYCHMFQGVEDEDYGGITEILKEGLLTSFATFLVSWIIVYSALAETSS